MCSKALSICLLAMAAIGILPQKAENISFPKINSDKINPLLITKTNKPSQPVKWTVQPIDTQEPNRYSAIIEFSEENYEGEKIAGSPSLAINIARKNENRQLDFNLPKNERFIFLNLAEKKYLILPNRQEFTELNNISSLFDSAHLIIPENIIKYLKSRGNYKRIDEEEFKGRKVYKYLKSEILGSKTSNCQSNPENLIYIDRETKLPLRTEFTPQLSGNIPAYLCGSSYIIEIREVKTDPKRSLFVLPRNYKKIKEIKAISRVKAEIHLINQMFTVYPSM